LNLDEMLIYADIGHIHNIADQYQCRCNRHSKTEMIQTIIYTVFRQGTLDTLISQMDDVEFTFIQLLYLDARTQYLMEDLLAKGKQAITLRNSSIQPRELIISALKKGWIFQGVGRKYAFFYMVPHDLKKKILQILIKKMKLEVLNKDQNFVYRDERNLIISDVDIFLQMVSKKNILLTAKGNIYKKHQKVILDHLQVKEEPLGRVAWRFGYGRRYHEYPDRFSLIYDFAFYHGLIAEDENGYLLITKDGLKWLDQANREEEEKKIYTFWVRLYKRPIPFLQLIIKWIDLAAYNQWVQLNSMEEEILFWLRDHYYETKSQVFHDRIIKMLLHLGVLQLGYQGDEAFIRVTEEGHRWLNGYVGFDLKEIQMDKK